MALHAILPMADLNLPFFAHLQELRNRLLRSVIAIAVGFLLAYAFSEKIFAFLAAPITEATGKGNKLVYTGLPDAFMSYFKISLVVGIIISFPFIIFQIWRFLAPGLDNREKKYTLIFVISSSLLFFSGALFGYFVMLPMVLNFLLGFAGQSLQPFVTMTSYLVFAAKSLLAVGIAFEIPFFLIFLAKMDILPYEKLRARRKYYILVIFIAAAVLTPPDIVSQVILAVPLVILYELGTLGARLFTRPAKSTS